MSLCELCLYSWVPFDSWERVLTLNICKNSILTLRIPDKGSLLTKVRYFGKIKNGQDLVNFYQNDHYVSEPSNIKFAKLKKNLHFFMASTSKLYSNKHIEFPS